MLESIIAQPNTLLMWPGPEAEDLGSFLTKQHQSGASDVKYTLIVLDGTWHQARSLYNQNSFLHSMKHVRHLLIFYAFANNRQQRHCDFGLYGHPSIYLSFSTFTWIINIAILVLLLIVSAILFSIDASIGDTFCMQYQNRYWRYFFTFFGNIRYQYFCHQVC